MRHVAFLACLTACIGSSALWVRSYYRCEWINGPLPDNQNLGVTSWRGHLAICWKTVHKNQHYRGWQIRSLPAEQYLEATQFLMSYIGVQPTSEVGFLGYNWIRPREWRISPPHWSVTAVTAALALLLKPKPRRQFTLLDVLGALTFAALAFGALAAISRPD